MVMTWHSCHVVSSIHALLLLLSMLLSMCAVEVVGGQSRLLAVVAIGKMLGAAGMVGIDGGGWEGRIVACLFLLMTILDVATIFCNQIRMFLWGFQWNFHGIGICSMESIWTVPWNPRWLCLHSIWNPVESMWNPCGIHVELIIPSSFHMESMMSME